MIDFSKNSEKEKYVGNPFNCKFIKVSISEYLSTLDGEYHFSQLKFFFCRNNQYLKAIQFLFQKTENFGSKDPSSFISFTEKNMNKYIGAVYEHNPLDKDNIINFEEFTLQLSLGEEIILLRGCFKDDHFHRIDIKTNFGKFFNIGKKKAEITFELKFFNKGVFFDGLVIGADNNKIMYLKTVTYEDKAKFEQMKKNQENKHKKELIDISEDLSLSTKISPIYKTNIFGAINNTTIIIDDMEKSGLIMDIKENRAMLSEIRVFSNGKRITRIDNQYIFYDNNNKNFLISHQSNLYDKTNNNYIIRINKGDYINDAIIYLSANKKYVKDIELTTSKNIKLKTSNHKAHNYKELKQTKGKKLRILGMCIGREKYIKFVQFYYESTNLEL